MDYHFNLRQGSQKNFRMSPVLRSTGFDRCFSTKSDDLGACSTDETAVKPMLGLFTDLHTCQDPIQKSNLFKKTSKVLTPMTSFSSSSMSVSYLVGGFISNRNQLCSNSSQDICNLLDVLVNSFQSKDSVNLKMPEAKEEPFSDKLHNFNVLTDYKVLSAGNPKTTMNSKRTYADVTKGIIPKPSISQENEIIPLKISNINCGVNSNSNSMVTMYSANCQIKNSNLLNIDSCSQHSNMFQMYPGTCASVSMVKGSYPVNTLNSALYGSPALFSEEPFSSIEELIPCSPLTQHTHLTLPINSSVESHRVNRTSSECSVDSDDSFVVFQNEDDAGCDSISEEDCQSDDLDEVGHQKLFTCVVPPSTSPSEKKTKRVSFKPAEKLVEIHNIVTWDYAHRAARIGPWETYARDRVRFENRICQISMVLNPILEPSHRAAVFRERFLEKN